jgi:hypothetical protein
MMFIIGREMAKDFQSVGDVLRMGMPRIEMSNTDHLLPTEMFLRKQEPPLDELVEGALQGTDSECS